MFTETNLTWTLNLTCILFVCEEIDGKLCFSPLHSKPKESQMTTDELMLQPANCFPAGLTIPMKQFVIW